jgi:hypothetical protein
MWSIYNHTWFSGPCQQEILMLTQLDCLLCTQAFLITLSYKTMKTLTTISILANSHWVLKDLHLKSEPDPVLHLQTCMYVMHMLFSSYTHFFLLDIRMWYVHFSEVFKVAEAEARVEGQAVQRALQGCGEMGERCPGQDQQLAHRVSTTSAKSCTGTWVSWR